jgi:hypothetical protein
MEQETMNEQVFIPVRCFVSYEINSLSDTKSFEAKLARWGLTRITRFLWTGEIDPNKWPKPPLIPETMKADLMQGLDLAEDRVIVIFIEGPWSMASFQ